MSLLAVGQFGPAVNTFGEDLFSGSEYGPAVNTLGEGIVLLGSHGNLSVATVVSLHG